MSTPAPAPRQTSKVKLAVFWLYVLVPLTWGVVNTLAQALKLFS